MKLIKQTLLYFQEGKSDKVYEIDLCEVGDGQFVVNFRYGRRGTTLRDGTKTLVPVDREHADRIYERLVDEKTLKGYQVSAGAAPTKQPEPEIVAQAVESRPSANDPVAKAILQRIQAGHRSKSRWPLSRAVWRAGELRLNEVAIALPALIGTGNRFLDYSIAFALGRCGTEAQAPALRNLQADAKQPYMVRRMAAEAMRALLDDDRRRTALQAYLKQLPEELAVLAESGTAEAFQAALSDHLREGDSRAFTVLEVIYFLDTENVRPALLDVLRNAPLTPNYFQRIRRIFKSAEARRDAEVCGIIAYRFEKERGNFSTNSSSYWYAPKNRKPTMGPDATKAFSKETRNYLRRRVWRTLERMGRDGNAEEYTQMAVGILLPFRDDDQDTPRVTQKYDWSNARQNNWRPEITDIHWDRYSRYWAFNQILFRDSVRYEPVNKSLAFCCRPPFRAGMPVPDNREEAFPELWAKRPHGLLHLLDASGCEQVHMFAVKILGDLPHFQQEFDIDVLKMMLSAPYQVTAEFGFSLAKGRYEESNPDKDLVLVLANCVLETARRQSHAWIESQRQRFLEDCRFTLGLITSKFSDTRAFARQALPLVTLDDSTVETLVTLVLEKLVELGEADGEVIRDSGETLITVFGRRLGRVDPEFIHRLLRHPSPELQQLAGELVVQHSVLAEDPPNDIIEALVSSDHAAVRLVGVRIVSGMPDAAIKRREWMLAAMLTHPRTDVREAIRSTVRRLIRADRIFGEKLAMTIVRRLLTPGAPEGVPTATARLLIEDFRDLLQTVSTDTVWELLQSRSKPAQEVGGILLADTVSPDALSVEQIVRLASNDVLSVRQASWKMFAANMDRMRRSMDAASRILDAKWHDSREFAFQYFRENFSQRELSPEVLIGICDSVRDDVQQFGREMITRHFREEDGPEYLTKLSEHPTPALQAFVTNYLDRYAAGSADRIAELEPYFVTVLSRVNSGRVAKARVWDFLRREALKDESVAKVVAQIVTRQSATEAIGDKSTAIEMMLEIGEQFPDLSLPLKVQRVKVSGN